MFENWLIYLKGKHPLKINGYMNDRLSKTSIIDKDDILNQIGKVHIVARFTFIK